MNKKLLIGLATAIGVTEYTRYSRLMDSISIKPNNLKFSAEGTNLQLRFGLEITNTSSKSIEIKSVFGKMYIGDVFIGNYRSTQTTTIKPNNTTTLPVIANINAQEVLNNVEGKNLNGLNITLDTNSIVKFHLLGLIGIPVSAKNITTIQAGNLLREVNSIINGFKSLFKR